MGKVWLIQDALSGDSGKGRVASIFSEDFDLHIKYNGGANAGHTIVKDGYKFKCHYLPAGTLYQKDILYGPSMYIQPDKFLEELENHEGQVYLSYNAHLVLPSDIRRTEDLESSKPTGTTSRGISSCAGRKWSYKGLRVYDLCHLDKFDLTFEDIDYLEQYKRQLLSLMADPEEVFDKYHLSNKNILFEGNQGFLLDVDFGLYPFVSASHIGVAGIFGSVNRYFNLDYSLIAMKSYISHLTPQPFPTEMELEEQEIVRNLTGEFGTTTGRPRYLSWLDLNLIKDIPKRVPNAEFFLTHADSFQKIIDSLGYFKVGVSYNKDSKCYSLYQDLSPTYEYVTSVDQLIDLVEEHTGIKVRFVSTGAELSDYYGR